MWQKISEAIRNADMMMALGVVFILGVMILPLPGFLIDFLLVLSLASSVLMLLVSVYAKKALDFSVFPSLLLITTLFRLAINVATTRVILLKGPEEGTAAAGSLIQAFGEYVVGGNYAVGIIVFTILVIINFVVITKGAGRVAEVSARFTLDALPGKQMAIDADLNAGVINEEEARRRRTEIAREADFYGAMDGASKFVRGDAIAGILIVAVNVIGGIAIGILQKGMDFGRAAEVFTLLTVGDGLVAQIPAIIISTAAGIIVTRSASGSNLGNEFSKQFLFQPKALAGASAVMTILAFIGMPPVPFLTIAGVLGFGAFRLNLDEKKKVEGEKKKIEEDKLKPSSERLENLLPMDILGLEVGYGLVNIVDADQNGDLLERVTNIRKQFALDLGIIIPPLRIRDNLELKPGDYQVLLKGVVIGEGSLMVGNLLAMDPGNTTHRLQGIPTKEPVFGLDAIWISQKQKDEATLAGYTVVDLSTVIATHLTELIRGNASELLGRQELQQLLDSFKQIAPKVVDDLIPNLLPLGTVLRVVKNLLKESVSIRDLRTILESLADQAPNQKDPSALTEYVRSALGRNITKRLLDTGGQLNLITLDRTIEETIAQGVIHTDQGTQLSVDPEFVRQFIDQLNRQALEVMNTSNSAVVLCSPLIRPHVKQLVDRFIPNIVVLSHNEIASNIHVRSIGTVRLAYAS